jgi:hypothetical protein
MSQLRRSRSIFGSNSSARVRIPVPQRRETDSPPRMIERLPPAMAASTARMVCGRLVIRSVPLMFSFQANTDLPVHRPISNPPLSVLIDGGRQVLFGSNFRRSDTRNRALTHFQRMAERTFFTMLLTWYLSLGDSSIGPSASVVAAIRLGGNLRDTCSNRTLGRFRQESIGRRR